VEKVYKYKKKLVRGSDYTWIVDAPIGWVESFIPREEFALLFGGYLWTSDSENPTVRRYEGVWAQDKIRKFKRALRERGALFEVSEIDGQARNIMAWATCKQK